MTLTVLVLMGVSGSGKSTVGAFRHPNVVDVYDVVQDGDNVFMVMELLEGEPLTMV